MLETDADRLASIQALGGQLHTIAGRLVWAIFEETSQDALGAPVETNVPVLECRTSDVSDVLKEQPVTVGSDAYRIRRVDKNTPAPGWTTLRLKR